MFCLLGAAPLWSSRKPESLRDVKCPEITFWCITMSPHFWTCALEGAKRYLSVDVAFPLSPIVLVDLSRHGPSLQRMWWRTMSVSHFQARLTWWNFLGFVFSFFSDRPWCSRNVMKHTVLVTSGPRQHVYTGTRCSKGCIKFDHVSFSRCLICL